MSILDDPQPLREVDGVPSAGKPGITYKQMGATGSRPALQSDASLRNQVGSVHAGVLFPLAESARGAVVTSAIRGLLDRFTPVATSSKIAFHAAAVGDLVASAVAGDFAGAVEAAKAGRRAEIEVRAGVRDGRDHHWATAVLPWLLLAGKVG